MHACSSAGKQHFRRSRVHVVFSRARGRNGHAICCQWHAESNGYEPHLSSLDLPAILIPHYPFDALMLSLKGPHIGWSQEHVQWRGKRVELRGLWLYPPFMVTHALNIYRDRRNMWAELWKLSCRCFYSYDRNFQFTSITKKGLSGSEYLVATRVHQIIMPVGSYWFFIFYTRNKSKQDPHF